jgi:hypothetical protein
MNCGRSSGLKRRKSRTFSRGSGWAPGTLLGGMVPIYAQMSAFHAAPWLRLIAGERRGDLR